MKQNTSFLLREIANVPYLIPYGQMIADHKRGVQINATGAYLWELLAQERTMEELQRISASYYGIPNDELEDFNKDISTFVNQLIFLGIVEDTTPAVRSTADRHLLSIAGLTLELIDADDIFPTEFTDFIVQESNEIHQQIIFHRRKPRTSTNGTLLLRNQELTVIEQDEQYILLFPQAKQIVEIQLKKDASLAHFYYLPPCDETLKTDVFHAIRLLYLFLAQKHHMAAIHSASILYQDKIWLFSGHSGMGKSTHTALWNKLYQTPLINGDLNLLAFEGDTPVVHGIPWCGTSGIYDTKTYPLGGIILLDRAPTDYVTELSADIKQLLVLQRLISPNWTAELFDMNLDLVKNITEKVLICKLHCTKEDNAAETMKEYIDKK